MTTTTKFRTDNSRRAKTTARRQTDNSKPRYVTKNAAHTALNGEQKTENAWVMFALSMVLLVGLGFIVGITYVLLLG